ncbi:MAG TPA: methyl-accepting chemotaxis protein, partial [Thermodesulfovibrionales bacterium]|nr:methyl-accepting chemotaxis protein [Thermodesulfovibrionales bacterium]
MMKNILGNLKISGKLLLAPLVIVIFMMIPSTVALVSFYHQKSAIAETRKHLVESQKRSGTMNELTNAHAGICGALRQSGLTYEGKAIQDALKEQIRVIDREIALAQETLQSAALTVSGKKLYEASLEKMREYRGSVEGVIASAPTDRITASTLADAMEGKFRVMYKGLLESKDLEDKLSSEVSARLLEGVDSALSLVVTLVGMSVSLSLLVSFLVLNKKIILPLKAMESAARKISEGDLSFDVETSDRDEIGRLSGHLRESFGELGRILQRIKELSERISKVVEDVERESKNMLNGAEKETEAVADISTSIEELNATATEIADNTESLAASTGETSVSVEQMVRSIGSINGNIQSLSEEVESTSSSIEELSLAIRDVASNAVDLATAAEATLSSISQITVGIREVEDNIKESARLSEKVTSDAATFGMASIEKTIQGMKNIQSSVEHTAQFIEVLGKRSDEIGKILSVIDEITDQTGLLALNAAILAAQAGEHGKGFSVVASEIKDLAERTSLSTKEIVSLIESVRQGVSNASEAMGMGIISVQEGFELAQEAGDSLKKILDSSRISSEMALSIERSTIEQAKA